MAENTIHVAVIVEGDLSEAIANAFAKIVRNELAKALETPRQRALDRRAVRRTRRLFLPAIPTDAFSTDVTAYPGWKPIEGEPLHFPPLDSAR